MNKEKAKIVTLEGTTFLTNKNLADRLTAFFNSYIPSGAFRLTQKPRVQVVQAPRKEK